MPSRYRHGKYKVTQPFISRIGQHSALDLLCAVFDIILTDQYTRFTPEIFESFDREKYSGDRTYSWKCVPQLLMLPGVSMGWQKTLVGHQDMKNEEIPTYKETW